MVARIALYWHNGLSLGHISPSAKIGRALAHFVPGSAIIGIGGSSRGLDLLPRGMDLIKLPSYLAYDRVGGYEFEPILPISERELFRIREDLILTFVKGFRPHILHVEFEPQGINGELAPAIVASPDTKKVLGLRGVLASREETNQWFFSKRMVDFIDANFCAIHAHTDPQVFRIEHYYDVPTSLASRIEYTGYLAEPVEMSMSEARDALGLDDDAYIIVASFGGGQGTHQLWLRVLESLTIHRKRFDKAYLATGPYLEDDAYESLQAEVADKPNIILQRFLDELPVWMKASNLFIGAGGVNTLGEVIAAKANALIISRQINDMEQHIHSSRLAELGIIRHVSLPQALCGALSDLLDECISEPLESQLQITVGGAQTVAKLVSELL